MVGASSDVCCIQYVGSGCPKVWADMKGLCRDDDEGDDKVYSTLQTKTANILW